MTKVSTWTCPTTGQEHILDYVIEMNGQMYQTDKDTVRLLQKFNDEDQEQMLQWIINTGVSAERIRTFALHHLEGDGTDEDGTDEDDSEE